MAEKTYKLVRLARAAYEDDSPSRYRNVMEFTGDTLGQAVDKALMWNADRTNHGLVPIREPVIEEWLFAEQVWVPVDLAGLLKPDTDL